MRRRKDLPGNICRMADGTYLVRIATHANGEYLSKKRKGIITKWEAEVILKEFREWLVLEKNRAGAVTWVRALNEYLDYAGRMAARPNCHATLYDKKTALIAYTHKWNEIPIQEFFGEMIEVRLAEAFDVAGIEDTTKNKIVGYVKEVFGHQVFKGRLQISPALNIRFGEGRKIRKPLEAMTQSEITSLLNEARRLEHSWEPIWTCTYQLGGRNGEMCELRVGDVDFDNRRVSIARAWNAKEKRIGPTKNGKTRVIPISTEFSAYLKRFCLDKTSEDFLLPQFKEMYRGESAEHLRIFQRQLGIRLTNFHSLRASFITHLLLNGVSIERVQKLADHADISTTMRYVRMVASDLEGTTDVLAKSFGEISPVAAELPLVGIEP